MGLGKPSPARIDLKNKRLRRSGEEPSYKETKGRGAGEGDGWGRSTGEVVETRRREGPLLKESF